MTEPFTLLQLAGAPMNPAPLDQAALLLIDHQKEYAEGRLTLPGIDAAAGEIGRLQALARSRGVPIVHIQHRGKPGGMFDTEGRTGQFIDGLGPQGAERVVQKTLPNAFAGTELDRVLKEIGRKELIVAGFMTHMCVSASVRSALDHGYRCTVVAKAVATRDLPDGMGGTVSHRDIDRATLAALADRFAIVVRDADAWR